MEAVQPTLLNMNESQPMAPTRSLAYSISGNYCDAHTVPRGTAVPACPCRLTPPSRGRARVCSCPGPAGKPPLGSQAAKMLSSEGTGIGYFPQDCGSLSSKLWSDTACGFGAQRQGLQASELCLCVRGMWEHPVLRSSLDQGEEHVCVHTLLLSADLPC